MNGQTAFRRCYGLVILALNRDLLSLGTLNFLGVSWRSVEYNISYVYHSLHAYFDRVTIAQAMLPAPHARAFTHCMFQSMEM